MNPTESINDFNREIYLTIVELPSIDGFPRLSSVNVM
jgi:hypothetical protein